MKLIKIAHDHYIIVDESKQPVEGYYYDNFIKDIRNTRGAEYGQTDHCWQITDSTQPLEYSSKIGKYWGRVQPIELSEVKELIGEVDVEKNMWYKRNVQNPYPSDSPPHTGFKKGFEFGYNQALEDNKEKKWTDEDLRKAIEFGYQLRCNNRPINSGHNWVKDFIAQSLQPKTEWEVEFVDGKLALKK